MNFRFELPWFLLLTALAAIVLVIRTRRGGAAFGAYGIAAHALRRSYAPIVQRILAATALVLLAIAVARPQYGRTVTERTQAGRDLMLVIDLSLSMQIDDMIGPDGDSRDRLAAVMEAAKQFIAGREGDRIGLAFFGSKSLTSCPLTFDHASVREFLERTEKLQRELWNDPMRAQGERGLLGDGTNIGLGIGSALRWLDDEESQGKAIVVITDGKDSTELPNWQDPVLASRHAGAKKIRVHCIGVGNPEGSFTVHNRFGQARRARLSPNLLPDPARLQEIAKASAGTALMANDEDGLREVFTRIDQLEPSEQHVRSRDDFADHYLSWLIAGLLVASFAVVADPRLRGL
jgi:Ca-activated chloride channel homolog